MLTEPWYVWGLAFAGAVGLPGLAAGMLALTARRAGISQRPAAILAIAAAAWLAISSVLAGGGSYQRAGGSAAPWFGIAVGAVLAVTLIGASLPPARRVLSLPDSPSALTLPHAVRVVGVVFLIAAAEGHLPWLFALPAGLGDLTVGLAAPSVARRLARDPGAPGAVRFHLFGIADLVVALTLGFLCGLGPIHVIPVPPSTNVLSQLPLAVVPTVAVPVALALHLAALVRIRAVRRAPSPSASSTAGPLVAGQTSTASSRRFDVTQPVERPRSALLRRHPSASAKVFQLIPRLTGRADPGGAARR